MHVFILLSFCFSFCFLVLKKKNIIRDFYSCHALLQWRPVLLLLLLFVGFFLFPADANTYRDTSLQRLKKEKKTSIEKKK